MENLFSPKHLKTIISAQLSPYNYPTAHLLFLMSFHINKSMCSGCDWIYRTKGHTWAGLPTNPEPEPAQTAKSNEVLFVFWVGDRRD